MRAPGSIIREVAIKLLGEPAQRLKGEWKYGNRGSLVIDLIKGVWHDFQAGAGGGELELIIRERGGDRDSARQWLNDNGFQVSTGSWDERIERTYDYVDESRSLLFQVVRLRDPKHFVQRRRDPGGDWVWKTKGVRKVPYHLPELIEAVAEGAVVLIVEGEKDADNLRKLGFCATSNPGGAGKWRDEYNEYFRGADVVIIPDNDPQAVNEKDGAPRFHPDGQPVLPGQDHGDAVAAALQGVAKRVRWLELPGLPLKGDTSDWIAATPDSTAEKLLALIAAAPDWTAPTQADAESQPSENTGDEELLKELSKASRFDYDRKRKDAAKALGISVRTLDQVIKEKRAEGEEDGAMLPHWKVEPAAEAVDGVSLLDALAQAFNRFIVLPPHGADMLALWSAHTWVFDCFDISPYLAILAPEPRCGKSTVLTLLLYLARRAEKGDNMSAAAIFRGIEEDQPTLLVDEFDQLGEEAAQALRSILNGGHTRLGYVSRCEGDPPKRRRFRTFCPKAFAAIGKLSETQADRSITLAMKRKLPHEKVEHLSLLDSGDWAALRCRQLRWAVDHEKELRAVARVDIKGLHDRANDNWHGLLAIAAVAGGDWPKRAREAALAFSVAAGSMDQIGNIGEQLLSDLRDSFATFGFEGSEPPGLTTAFLLEELTKDPSRPWSDWKNGKPISAHKFAGLLRRFQIFSQEVWYPTRGRGYALHALKDAFDRYLPDSSLGSSVSPTAAGTSHVSQSSGSGPNPELCEGQETLVAVAHSELPSFENDKSGRAHTFQSSGAGKRQKDTTIGSLYTSPNGGTDTLEAQPFGANGATPDPVVSRPFVLTEPIRAALRALGHCADRIETMTAAEVTAVVDADTGLDWQERGWRAGALRLPPPSGGSPALIVCLLRLVPDPGTGPVICLNLKRRNHDSPGQCSTIK
jgi:hypothetical protein